MSDRLTVVSHSEAETDQLGGQLANALDGGLTIALNGELGAGKTRFVRALCGALGINTDTVSSPTFVLLQLYTDGRLPVAHFDTYRLGNAEEFLSIGADEFVFGTAWVALVEWADRVADVLPDDRLTIRIEHQSPTERSFEFTSAGRRSNAVLKRLIGARSEPQS